jgi:hypothetical protein
MQLLKSITPKKRRGYALLTTLAFLCVALITFASLMGWVGSNAKITKRNNLFNQSQAAAESATEIITGTMTRDFFNQSLNPASSYTGAASSLLTPAAQAGWPIAFQFSDTNGTANASTVIEGTATTNWSGSLPAQFSGLYGNGQFCDVYSRATPLNVGENLTAMNHQQLWFGTIPIFQFAIFYNMDLEFNPGTNMIILGRVHSNNNIFAAAQVSPPAYLSFSNIVDAAQTVYLTPNPQDYYNNNANQSGNNVIFGITTNNPLSHAQVLSLPIGTNNDPLTVRGLLGLPPAGTDPASVKGQAYPYNEADIIVSNSPSGALSVYYNNLNNASVQTLVPMDVTNVVGTTTNTYYSFVTNVTFYDYRENTNIVYAVQLDVGNFNSWLANTNANGALRYQNQNTTGSTSKGHGINGVYVYNSRPFISGSGGQLPAVRVFNGSQLPPAGLTVATPFPLYVQGNYNVTTNNGATHSWTPGDTTNTYPAALMGDSITVLSKSWNDTNGPTTKTSSRVAANTTLNAACIEGIVPSNLTNNICSGGVQNFVRLLEDWGNGKTLTYDGSIVVLFPSQYATSPFQSGGIYYSPPIRLWAFDQNFLNPGKLPPMTPQLRAFARTLWSSTQ